MSIVLCRVDDRLIHGQVVLGWGTTTRDRAHRSGGRPGCFRATGSRDFYRMAVSPEIEVRFVTLAEASRQLPDWQANGKRGLVLTGDLETMAALRVANPDMIQQINLGGVHHQPGRRERLPFLYLTDQELGTLRGPRDRRGDDHCSGSANHASGCAEVYRMTDLSPQGIALLLVWGTLVGLDLVSVSRR